MQFEISSVKIIMYIHFPLFLMVSEQFRKVFYTYLVQIIWILSEVR